MKEKLTYEKIIWLFVIGCLIGFGVETIWYFLKHQVLINKQGLLYGPFKPVYGFGVVLLTILLVYYKDEKNWKIFLFGVVIGTIFEYFCSIFQEVFFGTYTWTYAHFKYSISDRIYLPYCIGWGILTLIWIKVIYPFIVKHLAKLPKNINFYCVVCLTVFMLANLILTSLAVDRMAERANGLQPKSRIDLVVDKFYPDEIMQKKFPKLRVIK